MKNNRSVTKTDQLDVRIELSKNQYSIPKSKLSSGSLNNKYPVILDGGKTIIFISDRARESEIREKYAIRQENRLPARAIKAAI